MNRNSLFVNLEKGLKFLAGLALALLLFQGLGVIMYLATAWPAMSVKPSTGIMVLGIAALIAGLARSALWIRIYWNGSKAMATLRTAGESGELLGKLMPILNKLTRLLIASCALDFLLLPGIFLMDRFFPFAMSGVQLGMTMLATLLIPEAFGVTALVLAYLAHQYGQLVKERCRMKSEIDLTI